MSPATCREMLWTWPASPHRACPRMCKVSWSLFPWACSADNVGALLACQSPFRELVLELCAHNPDEPDCCQAWSLTVAPALRLVHMLAV